MKIVIVYLNLVTSKLLGEISSPNTVLGTISSSSSKSRALKNRPSIIFYVSNALHSSIPIPLLHSLHH